MLKHFEIKIVAVVLGALFVVFAAVLLVINLSVYQTSVKSAESFMKTVAENDGFIFLPKGAPDPVRGGRRNPSENPQMMRSGRFFYAKIDENGNVIELNLEMMFDFSGEDALRYIDAARDTNRGSIENFSFLTEKKPYGKILVFAERSIEISLLEQLTRTSLRVACIAGPILSCLAALFAKWIASPVKSAFDKQRRFISDASHELKTPLTIIGANVDVLQHEIGDNRRLSHIKTQSERMNGLVHDLLTLAKTEEGRVSTTGQMNISTAVLSAALEFESRAFEEGKQFTCEVEEGILHNGDEHQLRQLVGILVDNAIRYSNEGGRIDVSLRRAGGRPRISVYNTGAGVSGEEYAKIFERFYRSDLSRSRETGGYGIGLSIAKAIAEKHRWKITVSGEQGQWVCFDVAL